MLFGPRDVPRSSVRGWFVESLGLIHRRAWAYLCIGLLPIILGLIDGSDLLVVSSFPLMLACGCALAKGADHSQPVLKCLQDVDKRSWIRVFMVGSMLPVSLYAFNLVLIYFMPPDGMDAFSQNKTYSNSQVSTTAFLLFVSVTLALLVMAVSILLSIISFLWFYWTLCILPPLSAIEAFEQAIEGVMLNKFIVLLFVVSALLLLVVLAFPVLFFPWLALTTSMMYVSYRDIWLNKPKNEPAKSRDAAILASVAA